MSLSKRHRYPLTLMSDRACEVDGCTRRIKLRMVDQRDARICYRHWVGFEEERRTRPARRS